MATTIVTRTAKGAALTHTEMDANLVNLQTTADEAHAAIVSPLAMGNLMNPLLHLPLKSNLDMRGGFGPATVTFGRASYARYVDSSGIVRVAVDNAPRFEKQGLLMEGASANMLIYSEEFTANWVQTNVTLTDNAIVAPDAAISATLIDCLLTGGSTRINTNSTLVDAGQDLTLSAFVKQGTIDKAGLRAYISGGTLQDVYVDFDFAAKTLIESAGVNASGYEELDGGWFRIWFTLTLNNTGQTTMTFRLGAGIDSGTTGTFYAWGAQLEELPFMSSYIKTDGLTVTRARDELLVETSGYYALGKTSHSRTILIDFDILGHHTLTQEALSIKPGNYIQLRVSSVTNAFIYYYAGPVVVSQIEAVPGQTYRCGASVKDHLVKTYLDGIKTNEEQESSPNSENYPTQIYLGSGASHANNLFGHIKNFRLYDSVLTAEEMRVA